MLTKGQIVFSKSGRDKGNPFIVVSVDEAKSRVCICDGKLHKLSKPKIKNFTHLQPTNTVDGEIQKKLVENLYLLDSDLRTSLKAFTKES